MEILNKTREKTLYTDLDGNQQYLLFCSYFCFSINGIYAIILGSLLPLLSVDYGLNNTISGSLISSHQLGNLIAGFIAGIVPLYLGRKKSILFLSVFVVIGFALMLYTSTPFLLIIGFFFIGISRGSMTNFSNSTVNELTYSSASALNLLHSIFAIGALLSPFLVILSVRFSSNNSWKPAVIVILLLTSISLILLSQIKVPPIKRHVQKTEISYAFMKNKKYLIACAILFFYLSTESAINGWLIKYFVDLNIITIQYANILASLLWLIILLMRLFTIFLVNRISKTRLLLVTSIGIALFYFLLLATTNPVIITISIIGLGASMATIYPTLISIIGTTIRNFSMAMGTMILIGNIGAIIMPIITGKLSDEFGIQIGMNAIIIAIILLVAFIFKLNISSYE